ncbi:hypothetical protein MPH_01080 [Macrophomina phaseolina MS6]|uniref:Uncharacterized protein n=1 Tax=Macrophomina phaseolina (strain MS6) TaxID=1126212 RepID=K2S9L9_MACPH|nr:hypothetical protein MPH_01080 [Macrophomina phaseolina MS6]
MLRCCPSRRSGTRRRWVSLVLSSEERPRRFCERARPRFSGQPRMAGRALLMTTQIRSTDALEQRRKRWKDLACALAGFLKACGCGSNRHKRCLVALCLTRLVDPADHPHRSSGAPRSRCCAGVDALFCAAQIRSRGSEDCSRVPEDDRSGPGDLRGGIWQRQWSAGVFATPS